MGRFSPLNTLSGAKELRKCLAVEHPLELLHGRTKAAVASGEMID